MQNFHMYYSRDKARENLELLKESGVSDRGILSYLINYAYHEMDYEFGEELLDLILDLRYVPDKSLMYRMSVIAFKGNYNRYDDLYKYFTSIYGIDYAKGILSFVIKRHLLNRNFSFAMDRIYEALRFDAEIDVSLLFNHVDDLLVEGISNDQSVLDFFKLMVKLSIYYDRYDHLRSLIRNQSKYGIRFYRNYLVYYSYLSNKSHLLNRMLSEGMISAEDIYKSASLMIPKNLYSFMKFLVRAKVDEDIHENVLSRIEGVNYLKAYQYLINRGYSPKFDPSKIVSVNRESVSEFILSVIESSPSVVLNSFRVLDDDSLYDIAMKIPLEYGPQLSKYLYITNRNVYERYLSGFIDSSSLNTQDSLEDYVHLFGPHVLHYVLGVMSDRGSYMDVDSARKLLHYLRYKMDFVDSRVYGSILRNALRGVVRSDSPVYFNVWFNLLMESSVDLDYSHLSKYFRRSLSPAFEYDRYDLIESKFSEILNLFEDDLFFVSMVAYQSDFRRKMGYDKVNLYDSLNDLVRGYSPQTFLERDAYVYSNIVLATLANETSQFQDGLFHLHLANVYSSGIHDYTFRAIVLEIFILNGFGGLTRDNAIALNDKLDDLVRNFPIKHKHKQFDFARAKSILKEII